MNLSKLAIKRPVAVFICVLALVVFGISSVFTTPVELTPPMEMPMLMVNAVYPGAGPEEVEESVTRQLESAVSTLSGLKNLQSMSQENVSMVMLEMEYGTNMDLAHSELQEKLNMISNSLPDTVTSPVIYEMSMDMMDTITLSARATGDVDLLYYVKEEIVPQFEKLSGVASVEVYGGQQNYISIELNPESMTHYGLDMNTIANIVSTADFSIPSGSIDRGDQSLLLRGGVKYNSTMDLKQIPISLRSGDIIHLSDIATITSMSEDSSSVSRYNGNENVLIGIKKRQTASTLDVTNSVNETLEKLNAQNMGVQMDVIDDSGEMITSSIQSVVSALILGLVISMFVLFFFLGDLKASLIIGTSVPLSVLATLVLMSWFGISINLISLGGLVVGVGMMVDNSIVVLESCFRARDEQMSHREAALVGAKLVTTSVIASTITTIVVFLPISVMKGMSGQLFSQAGYTIMFSLTASLISAITLVPLLFCKMKPIEKKNTRTSNMLLRFEKGYGHFIEKSLNHKKLVVFTAIVLFVGSLAMIPFIGMELMPAMDQGIISINAETKPGLKVENTMKILDQIEEKVVALPDMERYSLNGSNNGGSVSLYLKKDRAMETDAVVDLLREQTKDILNCEITVSAQNGFSMGGSGQSVVNIIGKNYQQMELATEQVKQLMLDHPGIADVSSNLSNGNPQAEIIVDPVKASAVGMTPAQVVGTVSSMTQGKSAGTLSQNGQIYDIKVEYPKDSFKNISDLSGLILTSPTGKQVPLLEIASLEYSNSPQVIQRYNSQYIVTITGQTKSADAVKTVNDIMASVNKMEMVDGVELFMGGDMDAMMEEFTALFLALATAVLLVFMVMAVEFESMRNSIIVMMSVPFSMIGAFIGLLVSGSTLSMPSIIGFIELAGIVVNNAIVLIDYTHILREQGLDTKSALVKAGTQRLRPILMTTLTTCLSLLPLAIGIGGEVEMMQSMAIVIIGGLISSTFLTLILIPVFYLLFDKKSRLKKKKRRGKKHEQETELLDDGFVQDAFARDASDFEIDLPPREIPEPV